MTNINDNIINNDKLWLLIVIVLLMLMKKWQ